MNKIAIYGAGGFGREVAVLLNETSKNNANTQTVFEGFIDDFVIPSRPATLEKVDDVIIAIASPNARKSIYTKIAQYGFDFLPLVHPQVYLDNTNKIGQGCIICGGTRITCNVVLGEFNIINLNVVIGHDVKTGRYCSVMPSVNLLGGVTLGDEVFIGAGATIFQNVTVGTGAVIGAGSVVTKDVEPGQKVIGSPARLVR